jgi:hypothetical protein
VRDRWIRFGEWKLAEHLDADAERLHELQLGLVINRSVQQFWGEAARLQALRKLANYPLPWEGFGEDDDTD